MELLIFRRYNSKADLIAVCDELRNNSIVFEVDDNGNSLDSNFGNTAYNSDYILKIGKNDFNKASQIIEQLANRELQDLNKEHFLFDFSENELKEVIKKRDEWGDFNFSLAKKILSDRGFEVDDETIKRLESERIQELSKPEANTEMISSAIGYISAFLGGPLGFLIGYYLSTFKKTLPNGETMFYYSEEMRKRGRTMIFIGVLTSILWVFCFLFKL